ncbi:MAG: haloacid dehalogenase, partial [Deltaproteobacteria bacterium]
MPPLRSTFDAIVSRHRAVFLDAYGVLVDERGAIAHAASAIDRLDRAGTPWYVLTNDASRLPSSMSERFRSLGLAIPTSRIVAPGDLLPAFFTARGLRGARTAVLGSPDSHTL